MDERIARLTTWKECEQLAINVEKRNPALAKEARRQAIVLQAVEYGAKSDAELEAIQAVYAYERVLNADRRRTVHASRTWQMIKRHGIIGAVEKAVNRPNVTSGYKALLKMGMAQFAFEAVVCRHPTVFSAEALAKSHERLNHWKSESPGQ